MYFFFHKPVLISESNAHQHDAPVVLREWLSGPCGAVNLRAGKPFTVTFTEQKVDTVDGPS